jgi:hypothetical protein
MSDDPFSVFDYPRQILHIPASPGHTDQDTGSWVPGGPKHRSPSRAISRTSRTGPSALPEGEYAIGDRGS